MSLKAFMEKSNFYQLKICVAVYDYSLSWYSSRRRQLTGLVYSLPSIFTRATPTNPSDPGDVSNILSKGHSPRPELGSMTSAASPSRRFFRGTSHVCMADRYCLCYHFQNWPRNYCMRCHLFRGCTASSCTASEAKPPPSWHRNSLSSALT